MIVGRGARGPNPDDQVYAVPPYASYDMAQFDDKGKAERLDLPGDVAPKIVQCSIQEQNLSPISELCQYDT